MSVTIDFSPDVEARLIAAARRVGVNPATMVEKLVTDNLADISATRPDDENQAVISVLRSGLTRSA